VHVFADANVIKAGFGSNSHGLASDAHFAAHIGESRREFARDNFTAAFQNGDFQAGAGEAAGRDTAAVTGADDDNVVAFCRFTEWSGETGDDDRPL
jgi:hypothetical protein